MDQAAAELADTEDRLASDLQVLSDVFVGPLRAWAPQVGAELPLLTETLERLHPRQATHRTPFGYAY